MLCAAMRHQHGIMAQDGVCHSDRQQPARTSASQPCWQGHAHGGAHPNAYHQAVYASSTRYGCVVVLNYAK